MIKFSTLHSFIFLFFLSFSLGLFSQSVLAQQSQNELLKNFTATSLTVFKVEKDKNWKPFFEKAGKPWPITLEKSGESISKVIINRAGVIEEIYEPDLKEYTAYFKDTKHRLVFIDDNFYYIQWSSGKATIKYVLTEKSDIDKSYDAHIVKIENYINKTVAAQSGDRAQLSAKKAEQDAAEKLANSLKGKSVKSIAVKWIGNTIETGHLVKVSYGIEATLTDGKLLKTSNLGGKLPWDDFKITVQGAEFGEEMITISIDAAQISSDNVIMTVQSKHQAAITTTSKLPVYYNTGLQLDYSGAAGGVVHLTVSAGYRGGNGQNIIVSVKATTANGTPVNQIEISDANSGQILQRLKMSPYAMLTINAMGGKGSHGRDNTRGGNGGNGGNVTIIKDSNVGTFTYVVNNQGGNGGKHEDLSSYDGQNGSAGSVDVSTASVSFGW